jgi:hypothetical protein
MTEGVTSYAYRVGEAVLDPALLSISLLLVAFCMLWPLAAIPSAFLFVLCCVGLWIAGLPFPYSRHERAARLRGSK